MTVSTWGFISDVHMSSAEAVTGLGPYRPWAWLSKPKVDRLAAFLNSAEVAGWDKLFLVGDIVDTWICPHDLPPPTAVEVLAAAHNQPIVEGLRAFAEQPGKEIYWIEGNHDAGAGVAAAHYIHCNVCYALRFEQPPLFVRHGHESCLFNAKDPKGRPFPIGYYLSRLCATAVAAGRGSIGLNFQLIWDCKDKLLDVLKGGEELVDGVLEAVRGKAGVGPTASFVMPGGGSVSLSDVRAWFHNLRHDWVAAGLGGWVRAIECEYDPFYGIEHRGDILYIAGHTHDQHYGLLSSPESRYVNVGSWCDTEASYATLWLDDDGVIIPARAHLGKWGPDIDDTVVPAPPIPVSATTMHAVPPAPPH